MITNHISDYLSVLNSTIINCYYFQMWVFYRIFYSFTQSRNINFIERILYPIKEELNKSTTSNIYPFASVKIVLGPERQNLQSSWLRCHDGSLSAFPGLSTEICNARRVSLVYSRSNSKTVFKRNCFTQHHLFHWPCLQYNKNLFHTLH